MGWISLITKESIKIILRSPALQMICLGVFLTPTPHLQVSRRWKAKILPRQSLILAQNRSKNCLLLLQSMDKALLIVRWDLKSASKHCSWKTFFWDALWYQPLMHSLVSSGKSFRVLRRKKVLSPQMLISFKKRSSTDGKLR